MRRGPAGIGCRVSGDGSCVADCGAHPMRALARHHPSPITLLQLARPLPLLAAVLSSACGAPSTERLREDDLAEAAAALERNIDAFQRHDTEAYLAQYLDSPEFALADADSVRRGYLLFAEWRRAIDVWFDTLIADRPTLAWIGPGVVWAGFRFTAVIGGDTTRGVSERIFVKTARGWKIAVTGTSERCPATEVRCP